MDKYGPPSMTEIVARSAWLERPMTKWIPRFVDMQICLRDVEVSMSSSRRSSIGAMIQIQVSEPGKFRSRFGLVFHILEPPLINWGLPLKRGSCVSPSRTIDVGGGKNAALQRLHFVEIHGVKRRCPRCNFGIASSCSWHCTIMYRLQIVL